MELFSYAAYYDDDGQLIIGLIAIQEAYEDDKVMLAPRFNYNNIFYSMISTYTIVLGEKW